MQWEEVYEVNIASPGVGTQWSARDMKTHGQGREWSGEDGAITDETISKQSDLMQDGGVYEESGSV